MRFLCSSSDLRDVLTELMENCESARWAVAWAKKSAFELVPLEENWEKIIQLTVGTSFNHTDPDIITEYNGLPEVGFVTMSSGVFHPKVYYFEHGSGRWDCVVGSVNFTESAFSKNCEAAVRINQDDADAEETRMKIIDELDRYKTHGITLTVEDFEKYLEGWRRKEEFSSEITNTDPSPERYKKAHRSHDVPILNEGWKQYFLEVKRGAKKRPNHDLEDMLEVLEESRRIYRESRQFSKIDVDDQKRISGTITRNAIKKDGTKWHAFGSGFAHGSFNRLISPHIQRISDALDRIPLEGPVDKEDFDTFLERFRPDPKSNQIGIATRLLSFKRPDYFVCFKNGNKNLLRKAFEIQQNVTLENYWTSLIERIQESIWWNAPEPRQEIERRVWRGRVAMLETRFPSD